MSIGRVFSIEFWRRVTGRWGLVERKWESKFFLVEEFDGSLEKDWFRGGQLV